VSLDPARPVSDAEWLPTTPEELRALVRAEPALFNRLVDEGRITSAVLAQPEADVEPMPVVEPEQPARPASFDGGVQRQRPPAASFAEYRDLARTNPQKFNAMLDAGLISTSAS
jgi:hypothetical protein